MASQKELRCSKHQFHIGLVKSFIFLFEMDRLQGYIKEYPVSNFVGIQKINYTLLYYIKRVFLCRNLS